VGVLIDEPKFATSIRQERRRSATSSISDDRNAKAWWNAKESWERYDYFYWRDEINQHAKRD
jgi:hypothetical protein